MSLALNKARAFFFKHAEFSNYDILKKGEIFSRILFMKYKTKTILIFGISSFVGSNLAEFFKNDYRVVGTYYSTPIYIPGILTVPCDVLEKSQVQLVLFAFRPDITIYSVGLTSLIDSKEAPELADALNTGGLFNVSENCQRYKSKLIYLSSAFVFGGEERKYLERDIPDANTLYGKTKASSEFYIQRTSLNYLIFRCCHLYGRSIKSSQQTWFELLQKKIKSGQNIASDNFVYCGFLDVYFVAMIMELCLRRDISNRLFQISSVDMMTYYEFAKKYCEVFNDQGQNISKTRWEYPIMKSANVFPGEKVYLSLDVLNVEGYLNMKLPSIKDSLEFTYKRFYGIKKISRDVNEGITFI